MAFDRAEMDEMVERWLQANRDAEKAGDWRRNWKSVWSPLAKHARRISLVVDGVSGREKSMIVWMSSYAPSPSSLRLGLLMIAQ